jgi:hypothetical protein
MGVNTQGIMKPEVTLDQIVSVLERKFNVFAGVKKTHDKDYHTVYFIYNDESRMLSVFENYTDKSHTNKEKVTLIDLNLWGSSVELIRGIVEEFGGQMVESDCSDDLFEVKKIDSNLKPVKYQIVLIFDDGEVKSILLDRKPSDEQCKEGMLLYRANSYRIDEIEQ